MPSDARRRPAIYARVSTDMQAAKEEGSLTTQVATMRAYQELLVPEGGEPLVFEEEGRSGKNLKRPQLQLLLKAICAGTVSTVMVTRLDRLTRSLPDFYKLYRVMEKHNVQFVSKKERFDTTTAMGRAMLKLVLVFAELEREQTSERTIESIRARAERGLWNGGHPPLGYDVKNGGNLVVNEAEARIVRSIFHKYVELRSCAKVAAWAEGQGYRQKRFRSRRRGMTGGKALSLTAIRGMLKNPLFIGKIVYKDTQIFEGKHEAIVPFELFQAVNQAMSRNRSPKRSSAVDADYSYLLKGMIFDTDGYRYTPSSTRKKKTGVKYHYYRNVGSEKFPNAPCAVKLVTAPKLEAAVLAHVRQVARSPELVAASVNEANAQALSHLDPLREEVESLRTQAQQAEDEAQRVVRRALTLDLGDSELIKEAVAEAEQRRRQARAAVDRAEAELAIREVSRLDVETVRMALRGFDTAWEGLSDLEKHELLTLLVHKVVILSKTQAEVQFYGGTKAVAWLDQKDGDGAKNDKTPGGDPGLASSQFVTGGEWRRQQDSNL